MNQPYELQPTISPVETKRQRKLGDAGIIKLIPKLIESYQWRQDDNVHEVCQGLLQATEDQHPAVHKRLKSLLRHSSLKPSKLLHCPDDLVAVEVPRLTLSQVILLPETEASIRALIEETNRADELAAFDLSPRHKVLLHGEPGNGKTILAEAIATELGLPFLRVKYSGLVDSHLGESGKNINKLMEYASSAPCVVFLDEFDGIAIQRGGGHDVTEVRRITNQLLISLERLPSHCLFVAATNSEEQVDKAIMRRFDLQIEVPPPTAETRRRTAEFELALERTPGKDLRHLAERIASLGQKNLFEVVSLCRRIRRDLVLNRGQGIESLLAEESQQPS
ncbi:TPA: ATP-binding protein [Pseudomonas aeruginosa]|nr:ATP-binding protein [Pseudomonas aeruginosa]